MGPLYFWPPNGLLCFKPEMGYLMLTGWSYPTKSWPLGTHNCFNGRVDEVRSIPKKYDCNCMLDCDWWLWRYVHLATPNHSSPHRIHRNVTFHVSAGNTSFVEQDTGLHTVRCCTASEKLMVGALLLRWLFFFLLYFLLTMTSTDFLKTCEALWTFTSLTLKTVAVYLDKTALLFLQRVPTKIDLQPLNAKF